MSIQTYYFLMIDYSGNTEQFKTARTRSQGGDNNLKIMQKRHKKAQNHAILGLKWRRV